MTELDRQEALSQLKELRFKKTSLKIQKNQEKSKLPLLKETVEKNTILLNEKTAAFKSYLSEGLVDLEAYKSQKASIENTSDLLKVQNEEYIKAKNKIENIKNELLFLETVEEILIKKSEESALILEFPHGK